MGGAPLSLAPGALMGIGYGQTGAASRGAPDWALRAPDPYEGRAGDGASPVVAGELRGSRLPRSLL